MVIIDQKSLTKQAEIDTMFSQATRNIVDCYCHCFPCKMNEQTIDMEQTMKPNQLAHLDYQIQIYQYGLGINYELIR